VCVCVCVCVCVRARFVVSDDDDDEDDDYRRQGPAKAQARDTQREELTQLSLWRHVTLPQSAGPYECAVKFVAT
jgi:hypothetical protein